MDNIYETFSKIKEKPALYLGKKSIFQLQAFYYGYSFAKQQLGMDLTEEENDFGNNFHDWLQKRLDAKTTKSWASIILFRAYDEKDALDLFFKLLEEFINRNNNLEKEKYITI